MTNLNEEERRKKLEILQEPFCWLLDYGYKVTLNDKSPYIEVKKSSYGRPINIFIRAIDELNLHLTTPYLPVPHGDEQNLAKWKNCILKHHQFGESINEGAAWITIEWEFQLTAIGKGDNTRLYRTISRICSLFKNFGNDIKCGYDLGLQFKDFE